MDIYAEVQSSDPADLINSPFGGRYCGPIPPRRRISLYRAVALSFFTGKNETSTDLFGGRYQFVNACKYKQISLCQRSQLYVKFDFFLKINLQPYLKLVPQLLDQHVHLQLHLIKINLMFSFHQRILVPIQKICLAHINLLENQINGFG